MRAVIYDPEERVIRLAVEGKVEVEVVLSKMENVLLEELAQYIGKPRRLFALLDAWELAGSCDPTEETIRAHVKNVRRKLERFPIKIENVRGYGYKLTQEEGMFLFLSRPQGKYREIKISINGSAEQTMQTIKAKEHMTDLIIKQVIESSSSLKEEETELPLIKIASPFLFGDKGVVVTMPLTQHGLFRVYNEGNLIHEAREPGQIINTVDEIIRGSLKTLLSLMHGM